LVLYILEQKRYDRQQRDSIGGFYMSEEEHDGTAGLESMLNQEAAMSAPTPHEKKVKAPTKQPPVPTPTSAPRKGNEVFQQQGSAADSKEDYAKREFGIEIPVDAVPLPSGGRLYPEDHPFHDAPHVEYRGMTAREEDIRMSEGLIKKGTVITELIKSCIINKNADVNSLVSGDRNALMIAIRISGYGRMYDPTFSCPECSQKNTPQIDLANLDLKPLTIDPVAPGQNQFVFDLPISKKRVEFKFLTGAEEEKVMKQLETRKKRGLQSNNLVTTRLMSSIVSVDGNDHPGFIANFVSVMPAGDSLALRSFIDQHEPGVNMEVEFTCTSCDHFDNIQMPLGSNFFWPDSQR